MPFAPVKTSKWRKDEPYRARARWLWPDSVWAALEKAAVLYIGRGGERIEVVYWHHANGPRISPDELAIIVNANKVYVRV